MYRAPQVDYKKDAESHMARQQQIKVSADLRKVVMLTKSMSSRHACLQTTLSLLMKHFVSLVRMEKTQPLFGTRIGLVGWLVS